MALHTALLCLIVKNMFHFMLLKQITKGKLVVVRVQSCHSSCTICMLGHRLKLESTEKLLLIILASPCRKIIT
jgi:hypothetical protein